MPSDLKVLFWDIETAPMLAYIWSPWDQTVNMERLIHPTWLLCWSAKWAHERRSMYGVVTRDEAHSQDDSRIIKELADVIRQADVIVAHNGDKFDLRILNARLLQLGLEPIGPKQTIDTLKLAKENFKFTYNRLDYLGEFLGVGRKIKTDFNLWKQCYFGDEKALDKMVKYNIQDVILLEKVFDRMRPYVKRLPRLVDPDGTEQFCCPHCGAHQLQRRGVARTQTCTYQKYQCTACQRYCRMRRAETSKFSVTPL